MEFHKLNIETRNAFCSRITKLLSIIKVNNTVTLHCSPLKDPMNSATVFVNITEMKRNINNTITTARTTTITATKVKAKLKIENKSRLFTLQLLQQLMPVL